MNERDANLHVVADDVFAWVQPDGSWWVNNAGAIGTPDGVIVVDTCATERRTRAFLRALADQTEGAPITCAVNTHQHGDHTYGNSLLPETAVIIGHEATRAGLLADPIIDGCPPFWEPVPDWGKVTRRPPTVTTSTGLMLHCGPIQVRLLHPGYAAHTAGDLVAWLPGKRVLFAGDLLFNGVTPLAFMGSIDGSLRALDWIARFAPQRVVPGHGPLIDTPELPGVLDAHRRYYQLVLDAAREGLALGLSPLSAARRCALGEFAELPDAERICLNLHRAYADMTGRELDLVQAFADAVALNGGPMRTAV
ncbi:MAG TPA: MBL fold metallo-hydrolase [Trebonia sp.]|jgi:cyclase|nr:MBL fold metallo-hydrolase [Trebonia sp.]